MKCSCENNRILKSSYLSEKLSIEGTLREGTDIINPVITVQLDTEPKYNYMFINDFHRWYFINNWTYYNNKLFTLSAHVDVLYTYSDRILYSPCIVSKTSKISNSNLYIDDGSYVVDSRKFNQVYQFSNGFLRTPQYILTVAGGVGTTISESGGEVNG